MRQLLSLVLALVCPLSLCACVSGSESVELEVSTERYLDGLNSDKEYRACFEFWYYTENPENDGSGNFRDIMHQHCLVQDFTVEHEA